MELHLKYKTLLNKYGVNTQLRLAHFFAQIHHENGGLVPKSENLYYTSVSALKSAFYSPFKGKSDEFIKGYLKSPQKLANYVYANRMGNGNEASGDGWKYRGRPFIHTTGKSNYLLLSKETGIDYVKNPDLLMNEADAMISALQYWKRFNLNMYADIDDLDSISDIINLGKKTATIGDANGYQHRKTLLSQYKIKFKDYGK